MLDRYTITLDAAGDLFAVVDACDYEWARRWKWHAQPDRTGKKFYAVRHTREKGTRKQIKVYMHKEILLRSGKVQPTTAHHIGDHEDGESLHNWRDNLDWATRSRNNRHAVPRKRDERGRLAA